MSTSFLARPSLTAWLANPASENSIEEIRLLSDYIALFRESDQKDELFPLHASRFYNRAQFLSSRLRQRLHNIQKETDADAASSLLMSSSLEIMTGFYERMLEKAIISDADAGIHATHALRLSCELYLIDQMAGIAVASGFWRRAYRLLVLSRSESSSAEKKIGSARSQYKRLLSLSTLSGQGLSPTELDWAAQFTTNLPVHLKLQSTPPDQASKKENAWFWIDTAGSAEPHACVRQHPPQTSSLLFFSTRSLAHHAKELLVRHKQKETAALQPSKRFLHVKPSLLAETLIQSWIQPSYREYQRQATNYQVDICIGLTPIWELLKSPQQLSSLSSRWQVRNESPGGFSVMHLEDMPPGIMSGTPIILRKVQSEAWSLCIVRWVRRKNAANTDTEVGLQLVAKAPHPVRIGFRNKKQVSRALLLPRHEGLRTHRAVLAPRGSYSSRHLTLVAEGSNVYVSQATVLNMEMQTAQIELFQIELDRIRQ